MKISAPKCADFQITTTRDAWFLTDPLLTTKNGDNIPQVTASNTIGYLGGRVSRWKGLTIEGLEEEFTDTFQRVERLALKPHQKEVAYLPLYNTTLSVLLGTGHPPDIHCA
jgi:hypothetical protein